MHHHTLVFFTVLSQTAVGTLIFREVFSKWINLQFLPDPFKKYSLFVSIGLLITSLTIAFFHLGKPSNAMFTFNNVRSSWLSREVLSISLLIIVLIIHSIIEKKTQSTILKEIFSLLSVGIGIFLVYSMIRLYTLPTVKSWYNPGTPVSFIITTFSCGLGLILLLSWKQSGSLFNNVYPLILVLIIASFINSLLFFNRLDKPAFLSLQLIKTLLGFFIIILVITKKISGLTNKTGTWVVIIFVSILIIEVLNRYIFFLSFEKSGL
jgi:DMSO reductase anchor subunit